MWIIKNKLKSLVAAMMLGGMTLGVGAQDFGELFMSSGTTANDGINEWGYILLQATDPQLLLGLPVAVYQKDGAADSTNSYALTSVIQAQTVSGTINLLLNRASKFGEDLADLESDVDSLFGFLNLDPFLTLNEKLSEIVQGSQADPEVFDNLVFLGRTHPGVALISGQAFAGIVQSVGKTTFELRTYVPNGTGDVIGRVTVEGGAPTVLTRPVNVEQVPDESPKGHLNVRLRWESQDSLLRLSLLHFGFDVYRMTRGYAEANGYHLAAPSQVAMQLALSNDVNDVATVNRLPILVDEEEATTNSYFFVDDNDRFAEGGEAFTDGEEFYYYTSALDILGRPGEVSTGLYVKICDTLPPAPPGEVQVRNVRAYTNGYKRQYLNVSWNPITSTNETTNIAYYVYRWLSITSMTAYGSSPMSNQLAGPLTLGGGESRIVFQDESLGNSEAGKTYWYTIQAAETTSCGTNWSGHSGPKFGVIRDWNAPDGGGGTIQIQCPDYTVNSKQAYLTNRDNNDNNFMTECYRLDPRIEWVEFWYAAGSFDDTNGLPGADYLGKHYYGNATNVSVGLSWTGFPNNVTFYCRAGGMIAGESDYAWSAVGDPGTNTKTRVAPFEAIVTATPCPVIDFDSGPHIGDFDRDGRYDWFPQGLIFAGNDSREHRIYRSVDNGERTLIAQGTNVPNSVTNWIDNTVGALGCAEVCYYLQQLDEHGNPGAITNIGCFMNGSGGDVVRPTLTALEPGGTSDNPTMTLEWFCPPYGFERFWIVVGSEEDILPADWGVADLSSNIYATANNVNFFGKEETNTLLGRHYMSGRVGVNFGTPDDPNFTLELPISLDTKYYVQIMAVDACENYDTSESLSMTWVSPDPGGQDVPWPARPTPEVVGTFNTNVYAQFLVTTNYTIAYPLDLAAVRIGELSVNLEGPATISKPHEIIGSTKDPVTYLFRADSDSRSVMPLALYRYQVANTLFPRVSGDVIQVSPLMEEIAYQVDVPGNRIYIHDPFIHVLHPPDLPNSTERDIWVADTQPVIRGATYQYLLVLFNEFGEMDRTIKLNTIEIPLK